MFYTNLILVPKSNSFSFVCLFVSGKSLICNSEILRSQILTFGMANLSGLSGPSSESEQAWGSVGMRGRWSGWMLIWVLRRLLTAFRELQVFGGREGSASRSEIIPWASPITAMSTTTLVPKD